jgi:hypothetical protein
MTTGIFALSTTNGMKAAETAGNTIMAKARPTMVEAVGTVTARGTDNVINLFTKELNQRQVSK